MDNEVNEQQEVQINSDSSTSQNFGGETNESPEVSQVLIEQSSITSDTSPKAQDDNAPKEVTSLSSDDTTPSESSHQLINSSEFDKDQSLPAAESSALSSTKRTDLLAVEGASQPLEDELTQLRQENTFLKERISKLETEVTDFKERVSKLEKSAKFKFENLVQEAIQKDDQIWDEDNQECQKYIEKAKLWESKTEALYSLISTAINDCGDRIDSCGDLMKQIQEQSSSLYNSLLNRYQSLELIKRMLERLREPLKLVRECNLPPEQLLRLQQGDLVDLLRSKTNDSEAKQVLDRILKEIGNNRYKSIREWRDLAEKLQKQWLNFIEKKLLPTLDGIRDGKIHAEHLVSELRPSYKTQYLQEYLSNWLKIYDTLEETLLEALKQLAVTKMNVQLGQPVDYERHEPIGTELDSILPPEHIQNLRIDKKTKMCMI